MSSRPLLPSSSVASSSTSSSTTSSTESSPRSSREFEKRSLPLPASSPPSTKPSPIALRKTLLSLGALALVLVGLSRLHIDVNNYTINVFQSAGLGSSGVSRGGEEIVPSVSERVVQESAPNAHLKDSLVEGVKYAATAVGAGFNNQLIEYIMLLQYARESGRVPILGDFLAASNPNIWSLKPVAPYMPFETVFDLSSYTASTSQKVLTFANLKLPSSETETLQCFATNHRSENALVPGVASSHDWGVPWSTGEGLKMDVWDAPVNGAWGKELDLGELTAFSEDSVRWEQAISTAEEARSEAESRGEVAKREEEGQQQQQGVPDQQLACWSDLYWAVDTDNVFDERWGVWPAWEKVGRHLRFAKGLRDVAQEVGRKVLGQREKPFIAIHARHGDFGCPTQDLSAPAALGSSCYRSPSSYLPTVKSIRSRLAREQGVEVAPKAIVVFSDETDERWWDEVRDMGWKRVDHKRIGTERKRDNWWPTLIDMVLMSQAKGFIGTSGSTYSLLAARRVVDWNQGIVTLEER